MSKTTVLVIFLLGLSLGIFFNYAKKAIEAEMPTEAEEAELGLSPEAKKILQNMLTDNPSDHYRIYVDEGLDVNTESLENRWSGITCGVSLFSGRNELEPTVDCFRSSHLMKPGVSILMVTFEQDKLIRYPEAKPQ